MLTPWSYHQVNPKAMIEVIVVMIMMNTVGDDDDDL